MAKLIKGIMLLVLVGALVIGISAFNRVGGIAFAEFAVECINGGGELQEFGEELLSPAPLTICESSGAGNARLAFTSDTGPFYLVR
jgi:hypothetical protein